MRHLVCILAAALLVGHGSLALAQHHDAPGEKKADAKKDDAHPAGKAEAHPAPAERQVMEWSTETGIWTFVIFLLLFFVLRKAAWGPILEGLKRREASIVESIEQAKHLREANAKSQAEFQTKLDSAHAEIPKLMEQARKDAAELREQIRTDANAEVQKERQRLLREIGIAQDQALQEIWNQAAQLATLISAKAIGRSLSADDHRRLIDEAMADLKEKAARR
jgi:F-type H+-transporting ATPase subunit b